MTNHRYTQIIVPIDKYLRSLTPRGKAWVGVLESSLLIVLTMSLFFYMG